jgi:hypothetical protein
MFFGRLGKAGVGGRYWWLATSVASHQYLPPAHFLMPDTDTFFCRTAHYPYLSICTNF